VGKPMFFRPHIAAETPGVVPPRHPLEDAGPGDVPPGLQVPAPWGFLDEVQTFPERALQNPADFRRDSNFTGHDEATAAVPAWHAAVRPHKAYHKLAAEYWRR
jgi:hypothetical protein